MIKRIAHCIKLNEQEENDFKKIKLATGYGVTAIFNMKVKEMLKAIPVEDET